MSWPVFCKPPSRISLQMERASEATGGFVPPGRMWVPSALSFMASHSSQVKLPSSGLGHTWRLPLILRTGVQNEQNQQLLPLRFVWGLLCWASFKSWS